MQSLGLIIGRFQPFHKGHQLLAEKSLQENTHTLLLIGSSNKQNKQNPWSFEQREKIILSNFENINIKPLPDFPNDEEWIEQIVSYISKSVVEVNIYCGDSHQDSAVAVLQKFSEKLPFKLNIHEVPRSIIPISGTMVREILQKENTQVLGEYLSDETIRGLENLENS